MDTCFLYMGNILGRLDIRNSFQTCRLSEVIGPVQYCGDTVEKAAPVTV